MTTNDSNTRLVSLDSEKYGDSMKEQFDIASEQCNTIRESVTTVEV